MHDGHQEAQWSGTGTYLGNWAVEGCLVTFMLPGATVPDATSGYMRMISSTLRVTG